MYFFKLKVIMEKIRYCRECLNKVEVVSYTYWDECNKCRNGMWDCGRDCWTEKIGRKYICKFCTHNEFCSTCDEEEKNKIEKER